MLNSVCTDKVRDPKATVLSAHMYMWRHPHVQGDTNQHIWKQSHSLYVDYRLRLRKQRLKILLTTEMRLHTPGIAHIQLSRFNPRCVKLCAYK